MAAKKDESKEMAESQATTAMVAAADFEEYAGQGFENQTSDDYAIPFINILQALSPQLDPSAGRDDLKQGMLFNTVTGEAFEGKTGIAFIPAYTTHNYIEFKPRDVGGGFVGAHEVDSDVVRHAIEASSEYGKYSTPEGNELVETFSVYGIVQTDGGDQFEAVIGFTSTKIKKYKGWMTKAKTIQLQLPDGRRFPAPLFAHRYRLKTVSEKAPKGSFFNFEIGFDGANAQACRLSPSSDEFQAAVAIKGLLESGKARANYAAAGTPEDSGSGGTGGGEKPVF